MIDMLGRHPAARVIAALALVAASVAWGAPARADVPGFDVRIGASPATFTVGKAARTLTAVISTDRGRRCLKVRWSLVVRAEGVSIDQMRVDRVEDGGSFATQTRITEDGARITDTRADPGQLCRGRTVTGRWDIGFAGPDDGSVTFEARATDFAGRVLSSASTTSRVVTPVAAKPSATPSKSPSATPSPDEETTETTEAAVAPPAGDPPGRTGALKPASSTPSVLGPGLIVGAVLVFLGVGLLLRIRSRNRRASAVATELPTGFYDMPQRRHR
jgi:hypothetical protein